MKTVSTTKVKRDVDVIAATFAAHRARGPVAEAMLTAACRKLDKLGTVKA